MDGITTGLFPMKSIQDINKSVLKTNKEAALVCVKKMKNCFNYSWNNYQIDRKLIGTSFDNKSLVQ